MKSRKRRKKRLNPRPSAAARVTDAPLSFSLMVSLMREGSGAKVGNAGAIDLCRE